MIVLAGLVACAAAVTFQLGLSKTCRFIFQIVSFHWLLKLIIQWKRGYTVRDRIKESVQDVVDNDDEMAAIIIETEQDEVPDQDTKDKSVFAFLKKKNKIANSKKVWRQ